MITLRESTVGTKHNSTPNFLKSIVRAGKPFVVWVGIGTGNSPPARKRAASPESVVKFGFAKLRANLLVPKCRDQHVHRAAAGGPNKATSRCATSLARWGSSVSTREVFCDKGECLTRVGKSLVASDMLHLTRSGSEFPVSWIVSKLGVE
ncbi:hypothetical protein ACVI1I_006300 [Bradyrhizobium sp. USDA 4459]